MWVHDYEQRIDLAPEQLWPVLADVQGWPAIDVNIGRLEIAGAPAAGTAFVLQPRGGPRLRFTISAFEPPRYYADTCHLLGATMTTRHELLASLDGPGTRIVVRIEVRGALAWFWGIAVGRRHAAGLPAQTERFVAAARQLRSVAPSV